MNRTKILQLICPKQDYLVVHSYIMIMNLSKSFHFHRDENEYKGNYLFRKNTNQDGDNGVCLVLNVSVNNKKEKLYEVNKAMATLSLTNELIEELVADEVIGFTNTATP
jgi:hypothetical protein